tara:strand:+ start:231 stop:488 length:258 start_codon:yes stop_codon:yes gene_type:complete
MIIHCSFLISQGGSYAVPFKSSASLLLRRLLAVLLLIVKFSSISPKANVTENVYTFISTILVHSSAGREPAWHVVLHNPEKNINQ